ncbi:uncharacterized protein Bfra_002368 [Botrytis fragariae]|uniref:Uncharacterized protein n=1 Tax=Botrytis fragariae TaxID=1964551 RepID=A0A8H6EKV3_9HELO|nr:uncharacterized protein Bfra_002368 [Botrytis fragariae]KAF5875972.1 hypothetical protein Bfra_002368 [Botrytis fragariae]
MSKAVATRDLKRLEPQSQGITTGKFYTAELRTNFFHTMIPGGNTHALPQWFSSPFITHRLRFR